MKSEISIRSKQNVRRRVTTKGRKGDVVDENIDERENLFFHEQIFGREVGERLGDLWLLR